MREIYALVFHLTPSSFFSVRQPHSFQSAIAYPLPPPSTLKGLLGNAMQQYLKVNPTKALAQVESKISLCTALTRNPIVLSLATLRLRVFDKGKWIRDALPRQFAFSPKISCAGLSVDRDFLTILKEALKHSILYLGDSESLVSVSTPEIFLTEQIPMKKGEIVEINTYASIEFFEKIKGEVIVYWVFEDTSRQKTQKQYIFPLQMRGKILYPTLITGELKENAVIFEADNVKMLTRMIP